MVNDFLKVMDADNLSHRNRMAPGGHSIFDPEWNLLYYSLLCSLSNNSPVVLQTGLNCGLSTIVMAQAMKDAGVLTVVHSLGPDPAAIAIQRENTTRAGLAAFVAFHQGDSLAFLKKLIAVNNHIDFALIQGNCSAAQVIAEFEMIRFHVAANGGKIYLDGVDSDGGAEALALIQERYRGNFVRFNRDAGAPAEIVLWQA
jgi:predicted O-methyltransferase YrrM